MAAASLAVAQVRRARRDTGASVVQLDFRLEAKNNLRFAVSRPPREGDMLCHGAGRGSRRAAETTSASHWTPTASKA